jgi:hypothetical protein
MYLFAEKTHLFAANEALFVPNASLFVVKAELFCTILTQARFNPHYVGKASI